MPFRLFVWIVLTKDEFYMEFRNEIKSLSSLQKWQTNDYLTLMTSSLSFLHSNLWLIDKKEKEKKKKPRKMRATKFSLTEFRATKVTSFQEHFHCAEKGGANLSCLSGFGKKKKLDISANTWILFLHC